MIFISLFAHKKGTGSSHNGRDSESKRLGAKRNERISRAQKVFGPHTRCLAEGVRRRGAGRHADHRRSPHQDDGSQAHRQRFDVHH